MKYTFGYIKHNKEINEYHLGACLDNLDGDYSIITTSDKKFPAENYNDILEQCTTDYLILSHEDVTLPKDFLKKLEITIKHVPDFGCLGMVGVDNNRNYHWSQSDNLFEVDTLDCCFLVINMKNLNGAKFDTESFGEYHLYVEDFCAQMNRINKKTNYTIAVNASEKPLYMTDDLSSMGHHSATVKERGYCWGRYQEFRTVLENKWPNIKTT